MPKAPDGRSAPAHVASEGGGGEFVVAFEGDAAAATAAVTAAGGIVVDVNEAVGIALVDVARWRLRRRGARPPTP